MQALPSEERPVVSAASVDVARAALAFEARPGLSAASGVGEFRVGVAFPTSLGPSIVGQLVG